MQNPKTCSLAPHVKRGLVSLVYDLLAFLERISTLGEPTCCNNTIIKRTKVKRLAYLYGWNCIIEKEKNCNHNTLLNIELQTSLTHIET
jgi:hypothetical protein